MLFGKYNHVVETLAANTADQAFGVWILPGRMWGGDHLFDLHSSYPPLKIVSVDRIPVSEQEAWSGVLRKRLDQLLGRPGGGRVFRDVEMNDLTSFMQKDDEAVKVTERRSRDSKEIDANDVPGMIGEESLPGLGGRLRRFDSVLSDSRFSHFEPE